MFIGNFAMVPTMTIYCYSFTALESVVNMQMGHDLNTDGFLVIERILMLIGSLVGIFLIYYISKEVKRQLE